MRRSDRLFDIIQIIRDGRLHKAADIADRLEVSVRTIYRDMDTLVASGIPIEGERGVGYILRAPISLPPMTLTEAEVEALALGVSLVGNLADPALQRAAETLGQKIRMVLPDDRKAVPEHHTAIFGTAETRAALAHIGVLRDAIRNKDILRMSYARADGHESERDFWPMQMEYWGPVWTCTGWCDLRQTFRMFRLDRIKSITPTGKQYAPEPGRTFEDLYVYMRDRKRD